MLGRGQDQWTWIVLIAARKPLRGPLLKLSVGQEQLHNAAVLLEAAAFLIRCYS